jgi:hypothetical protein
VPFTLLTLKNQGNPATSSAIIMNKMPFHEKQIDKLTTKSSLKKEMLHYLQRYGMPCRYEMRAFTLISLVEKICPKETMYHIDT